MNKIVSDDGQRIDAILQQTQSTGSTQFQTPPNLFNRTNMFSKFSIVATRTGIENINPNALFPRENAATFQPIYDWNVRLAKS